MRCLFGFHEWVNTLWPRRQQCTRCKDIRDLRRKVLA